MPTLNGGFTHPKDSPKNISDEDKKLIADFIAKKGVQVCPPSGVNGNEVSAITHERIMKLRRDFRQVKRDEVRAAKEAAKTK